MWPPFGNYFRYQCFETGDFEFSNEITKLSLFGGLVHVGLVVALSMLAALGVYICSVCSHSVAVADLLYLFT